MERDFTEETLKVIRENVDEGGLLDFWDNFWYTEIKGFKNQTMIEAMIDDLGEYYKAICEVNDITARRLEKTLEEVYRVEESYAAKFEKQADKLLDYKDLIDNLTACFTKDNFDTAFDVSSFMAQNGIDYTAYQQEQDWKNSLKGQYGFDDRTVNILLQMKRQLEKQYPQATGDWLFARIVGGFCYNGDGKMGTEFQWNQTAGYLPFDSESEFLRKTLLISEADYQYVRYKVRFQHGCVSDPVGFMKFEGHEDVNLDYKAKMEQAYGGELTNEEFIKIWNVQCEAFVGGGDYGHQMITISSILATPLWKGGFFAYVQTGGRREEMAGWLGDATIYGKKGDSPSFQNDDYQADLDAANIAYLMKQKDIGLSEATVLYYKEINSEEGRTRGSMFVEHTNIDTVKAVVMSYIAVHEQDGILIEYDKSAQTKDKFSDDWGISPDIENAGSSNVRELIEWGMREDISLADELLEKYKDIVPDTYNFIKSLQDGLNQMGDYHN